MSTVAPEVKNFEELTPEEQSLRRQQRKDYGRYIAAIVSDAITGIETATGRKVLSLTMPKPCNFEDPEKNPLICVKFVPTNTVGSATATVLFR